MILVSKQDHHGFTEFAPAMADRNGVLPGFPSVCGKPVQLAFDGGRLSSDGGILVLAQIERRLGIAERLAGCLEDPRDPAAVQHTLAEMIRFRALLIAAGYPDGNDCDALSDDPAFIDPASFILNNVCMTLCLVYGRHRHEIVIA